LGMNTSNPISEQPLFAKTTDNLSNLQPCSIRHIPSEVVASNTGRNNIALQVANLVVYSIQRHFEGCLPTVSTTLTDQRFDKRYSEIVRPPVPTIRSTRVAPDYVRPFSWVPAPFLLPGALSLFAAFPFNLRWLLMNMISRGGSLPIALLAKRLLRVEKCLWFKGLTATAPLHTWGCAQVG